MCIFHVESITNYNSTYVGILIELSGISGIMALNVDLVFEILKRVDGATITNAKCASSLFYDLQCK